MDISAKSKSRISKQISKIYGIDSKSMVMPQTLRNDLRRFPLLMARRETIIKIIKSLPNPQLPQEDSPL